MRYELTIKGTLDTSFDEAAIRRDFPMFVDSLARVHGDAVEGSITLVSVERLPDPEPTVTGDEPTADLSAVLAGLNAITARLDRAGL